MILHTVTMLEDAHTVSHGPIAICTTREIACEIVESNAMDIHETNHGFAVVASIGADCPYGLLHPDDAPPELWYRWEGTADSGAYTRCDKPSELERVVFGL